MTDHRSCFPAPRRHATVRWAVLAAVAGLTAVAACTSTTATTAPSGPGSSVPGATAAPGGAYAPGSDVASHEAIGDDVAAIRAELAKAKQGAVDWAAVGRTFTTGGASKKGDGSIRTLQGLVDAPGVVATIEQAIAGDGDDEVRVQVVEKGITALLHLKVIDELGAAAEKVRDGKTGAKDGAPHNVDEAWAFYVAKGNGPQSTAKKRGADFTKDVDGLIVASLAAAQRAAGTPDAAAFDKALSDATGALDTTFYLATHKYLDTGGDAVKRAEGETFFLAIEAAVTEADAGQAKAIRDAFVTGDHAAGRAALNAPAVVAALGIPASMLVGG